MALVIAPDGKMYRPYIYELEQEFESVVVQHADQIFGESTIYIDVKKQMRGKNFITIPDGYVVDMTDPIEPKLFVVENEIVKHDVFKHIALQMLRFVTSFKDARDQVRCYLMDEILKNKDHKARLEEGWEQSSSRNIDDYLSQAVNAPFSGLIVIDEIRSDLTSILREIRANISAIELRSFETEDGSKIHQFDTLYDEEESEEVERLSDSKESIKLTPEERKERRKRRLESDTIVVPAREDGFRRVFLGQDQWYAVRIGAAMKDRVKHIAAYQTAPVSAITHVAEVKEIVPYEDTNKYLLKFAPAVEVEPIPLKNKNTPPQGPFYVKRAQIGAAKTVEELVSR